MAYLSEKKEDFECKGVGDSGGKIVHTGRLLQEVGENPFISAYKSFRCD